MAVKKKKTALRKKSKATEKKTPDNASLRLAMPANSKQWLQQVLNLLNDAPQNERECYQNIVQLVHKISTCRVSNLYTAENKSNIIKSAAQLHLLGVSHKGDQHFLAQASNMQALGSSKTLHFDINAPKLFDQKHARKQTAKSKDFGLNIYALPQDYARASDKFIPMVWEEQGAIFYQPLRHATKLLGAMVVSFSPKATLCAETLQCLQLISLLFTRVLLTQQWQTLTGASAKAQEQIQALQTELTQQQDKQNKLAQELSAQHELSARAQQQLEKKQTEFLEIEKRLQNLQKQSEQDTQTKQEWNVRRAELEAKLATTQEKNKQLEQNLERLTQEHMQQQTDLQQSRERYAELEQKLETINNELTQNQTALETLRKKESVQEQEILNLQTQAIHSLDAHQLEIKAQKEKYLAQIRAEKEAATQKIAVINTKHTQVELEQTQKFEAKITELKQALIQQKEQAHTKLNSELEQQKELLLQQKEKAASELRQKIDELTAELLQTRQAQKEIINTKLQEQAQTYAQSRQKLQVKLEQKITELNTELKQGRQKAKETLNAKLTEQEQAFEREKEKLAQAAKHALQEERKSSAKESEQRLKEQVAQFKNEQQARQTAFAKEMQEKEKAWQQEKIQALQAHTEKFKVELELLDDYKRKCKEAESEQKRIQKENDSLVEQRASLLHQIEYAEKDQLKHATQVKEGETKIWELNESYKALKNTLRQQRNELQNAHQDSNQVNKEIGSYRARQYSLEKTLAVLNEDARIQSLNLTREIQSNKELQAQTKKQQEKIATLQKQLEEARLKQKKWEMERRNVSPGSDASKLELRPFMLLLNAISKHAHIEAKMEQLYLSFLKDKHIMRVLIYSILDEQYLQLEYAYSPNQDLSHLRARQPFLLSQSIFGSTLTSRKAQMIQADTELLNADIPEVLYKALQTEAKLTAIDTSNGKKELATDVTHNNEMLAIEDAHLILLLPLVENNQVKGLLTLAANERQAFDSENLQLLQHLMPLFALSLQQNRSMHTILQLQTHVERCHQLNHYVHERYWQAVAHTQKIMQHLERQLPQSIKSDLMPKLTLPATLVPPLTELASQTEQAFIKWVEQQAQIARDTKKLNVVMGLQVEAVRKLQKNLGTNFNNLYWLIGEAITNVVRHSHASQLEITLNDNSQQDVCLSIIDNGDGIMRTTKGTQEFPKDGGIELMRGIAIVCGAQFKLCNNAHGRGLALLFDWPVKPGAKLKVKAEAT